MLLWSLVNRGERPYGDMLHGEVRHACHTCTLHVRACAPTLDTHARSCLHCVCVCVCVCEDGWSTCRSPHCAAPCVRGQVINRVIHQGMRPKFKPSAWEPYVQVGGAPPPTPLFGNVCWRKRMRSMRTPHTW